MINEIKMLLIEDNSLLRDGIITMLKDRGSITIKTAIGRKSEIDQSINLFKPHVILLNLGLHSQNSLQVVKEVTEKHPDVKILVMDLSPTQKEIIQFVDAGATGFILKDATPQEFIDTIKAVADGEIVLPELSADLLLSQILKHAMAKGKGEIEPKDSIQITKFELRLLELVNQGLSDEDIGEILQITPESVKTHIHNIKQNLSFFHFLNS